MQSIIWKSSVVFAHLLNVFVVCMFAFPGALYAVLRWTSLLFLELLIIINKVDL